MKMETKMIDIDRFFTEYPHLEEYPWQRKHLEWLNNSNKGERANLSKILLFFKNLLGVNLSKASLKDAEFGSANLTGADFTDADLRGANFNYADLHVANFTRADLRGTDFTDADTNGADFTDALVNDETILSEFDQYESGFVFE